MSVPFSAALETGLAPLIVPVVADLKAEILAEAPDADDQAAQAEAVIIWTGKQLRTIEHLHDLAATFSTRMSNAPEDAERRLSILDFAEQLGASQKQLQSDAKAFDTYFGSDAVLDRYRRRIGERERAVAYGFERIGVLVALAMTSGALPQDAPLLSEKVSALLASGWHYRGDGRIRQATHGCMSEIARACPTVPDGYWIDKAISEVRRVALDEEDDAWSQCAAFDCLFSLSPASLDAVLSRLFLLGYEPKSARAIDNRLFVRRHLARLLVKAVHHRPELHHYVRLLSNDRSGAVRQALAAVLPDLPQDTFPGLYARLRVDHDPQVRAMVLAEPAALVKAIAAGQDEAGAFAAHLQRIFLREKDEFVVRLALAAAEALVRWQFAANAEKVPGLVEQLCAGLQTLRTRNDSARVRRWAGVTYERLWLATDAEARQIAEAVGSSVQKLREGKVARIKRLEGELGADPAKVGRVLALMAHEDFGFDYRPGRRAIIRRGDHFKRRPWRLLHELRISATDKRQAWLHTIGRSFDGSIVAPSGRLAELAPTKVPGEPLHQPAEAGWRNFLPLVDHVISAVDRGHILQLFTSEGITRITPPEGIRKRITAYWQLSWKFASLAALRNNGRNDFAVALRNLGIGIDYTGYAMRDREKEEDSHVTRLFQH